MFFLRSPIAMTMKKVFWKLFDKTHSFKKVLRVTAGRTRLMLKCTHVLIP